ncbi:MAG TPA: LLM class flavin-dependent oxidoreductase [Actinomycetota bacterium]|nr:LLM class flavin-dependent oxidoreductase [Actinomycetota bacterium]
MDIGIGLPNPLLDVPGELLPRWARRAEERGFAAVATIDRIAYPSYESFVALAAAAAATERIELLTNVLLAPTRDAVLLAKQAASVDRISGGRLTLGLGVGLREDDYLAVGRGFRDRGRRFDRDLETIHAAWRGERVGGSGHPVTPAPVRGSVPILFGGMSDAALRRVVRWGAGWTAGGAPSERVAPFLDRVRAAWAEAGRAGRPRLVALVYFALGDAAEAERNLRTYYGDEAGAAILARMPRDAAAARETRDTYAALGIDLLVFDPTVADLSEVDALAEAVLVPDRSRVS